MGFNIDNCRARESVIEPETDWVALSVAPLHYFGNSGFIRTQEQRTKQFRRGVEKSNIWVTSPPRTGKKAVPHPYSRVQWSAFCDDHRMFIEALGVKFWVDIRNGCSAVFNKDWPPSFLIEGYSLPTLLQEPGWRTIPDKCQDAFLWFRAVLNSLVEGARRDLCRSFLCGEARIMARINSPLAPFLQIHPDQWRRFQIVDDLSEAERHWHDPKIVNDYDEFFAPPVTDATSESGDRLFSIFVAPGPLRGESDEDEQEEQCIRYLEKCMAASPAVPPGGTRALLRIQCLEQFSGLSRRGFERCYTIAVGRTKAAGIKIRWSAPGRKSLRGSAGIGTISAYPLAMTRE